MSKSNNLGATYENGFTKDDPTIKWLWEIVHDYSLEQKKKLLFFTTGSDRAPIGGLGKMEFIIMKHGDDGDRYFFYSEHLLSFRVLRCSNILIFIFI